MANYNQLKTRAQQVRDEQTIGGNTALRVGQLLMDMVDAESETVDNIVELFTGTEDNPVIPTLPNPGLLHWLQSPIVALVSMGEDLDGDAGAVVQEGDLYYYNHSGYQIFVKGSGSLPGTGYKARQKVLYLNKYTGKLYEWTGADMSEIILAGTGGGGGNVTIEEGQNYIDITIDDNVPVIEVSTQSIVMSGDNKTATFTVSGHNLTAPIRINGGNAYFSKSPSSISPVGGIVEATTVTVTFGGDSDDTDDLIVSSIGAASKTIHVTYTAVAGPTILADSTLTIKAAAGQSNTGQLAVTGLNLTAGITATVSGTGFTVSASESGTYGNQASLPSSGGTLYVKFSPIGSSASTGTLTLESTGATGKTVDLTGAVSTLTVSPSSLSLSTTANTPTTDEFTIQGSNLTNGVTLALTDTNSVFSLSKNSLTKAEAEAGETITVTYSPTAAGTHNASIAINWDGGTENVSLGGTAAQGLPAGYTEIPYIQGHVKALMTAASFTSQWELDVVCDSTPSSTQILACSNSAGGHYAGALNNGKFGVGAGDGQYVSAGVTTRTTVVITFSANGISLTAGGETVTRTGDRNSGHVLILGSNDNPKYLFEGKCYGIRCLNENLGTFILCKNSSNQQGVYNTKQGVFFNLDA